MEVGKYLLSEIGGKSMQYEEKRTLLSFGSPGTCLHESRFVWRKTNLENAK